MFIVHVHDDYESKLFSCSLCDKIFRCKKHLRDHEDWHNRENGFECTDCAKNLSQIIVTKSMSYTMKEVLLLNVKYVQITIGSP